MSGDVSHFIVRALDGGRVDYAAAIWQRRNLLLVVVSSARSAERYAASVSRHADAFASLNTAVVITSDPVAGMPAPALLVADKWGEIVYQASAACVDELPDPSELLEWLQYVEQRCPECEGEAR